MDIQHARASAGRRFRLLLLCAAASTATAVGAGPAFAQTTEIQLSSQPLADALLELQRQTGAVIFATGALVNGVSAPAVGGALSVEEALDALLQDARLTYEKQADGSYVIIRAPEAPRRETRRAPRERQTDAIVVTATRQGEVSLQDTPLAVSVLNPEELQAKGFTNLDELIAFVPGFESNSYGPGGFRGQLVARGVGGPTGASGAVTVATYVDAVPVSGTAPRFANLFVADAVLFDIERIEFLKGPQGTLYGATAVGGALKYVTRKPSLTDIRGSMAADLSFTEHGGFNQTYSGRVSLPIVEDRLGVTVSGFAEDNDGFVDLVDGATGEVFREDGNAYDRNGYAVDLYFTPTDRFDARFYYIHQEFDWSDDGRITVEQDDLTPVYGDLANIASPDAETRQAREFDYYTVNLNYDFGWANVNAVTAYGETTFSFAGDLVANIDLYDDLVGNPEGATTNAPVTEQFDVIKFVHETKLASAASEKFTWLLGFFYSDDEAEAYTLITLLPTNQVPYDRFDVIKTREIAVFGNATYYLTPNFDVGFGFRVSNQDVEADLNVGGPLVGLPLGVSENVNIGVDATTDTYSFTLRYRPVEQHSFYARAASGFRPPIPNQQNFDPDTGELLSSPFIDPDLIWSYEIGAKGGWGEGLLSYDIALYYYDWDGYQFVFTPPGTVFRRFRKRGRRH